MIWKTEQDWLKLVIRALQEDGFRGVRCYVSEELVEYMGISENQILELESGCEINYFIEAGKNQMRCYTYFNQKMELEQIVEQMNISFKGASRQYEYRPYDRSASYQNNNQLSYTKDDCISLLKECLEYAHRQSLFITVSECSIDVTSQSVYLLDEDGKCISDCNQSISSRVGIVARNGKDVATAWKSQMLEGFCKEQMLLFINRTVEQACNGLGASSIPSGKYRGILSNHVWAEMLEAYLPVFFADMVQDQMSHYTKKLNERVACEELQLFENPIHPLGRCKRTIDDEGCLVQSKELIQNGKLLTFLYNQDTAQKDNRNSTGNGFKTSLTGDVGIQYTNIVCFSKMGNQEDVLLQKLGTGVYVRDVDGVFAGVNVHNGDFSLIAKGSLVKNGQMQQSFCDVTIAGNFFQLLKEIEGFGKDFACTPKGYGSVVTPSILVNEITISGI